jgi:hypothetical protein
VDALRIGRMTCESIEDDVVVLRVEHLEGLAPKLAYPENLKVIVSGSQLAGTFWKVGKVYSGRVLAGEGVGAI